MGDTVEAPVRASQNASTRPAVSEPQKDPATGDGAGVPDFRGTKHKVKVFDQEREVEYDELLRDYQLKQASHKALADAAQTRKQAEGLLGKLKAGDRKAFASALGGEKQLRDFAESLLIDDLEYESLPEPEKRARSLQQERDELQARIKQREELDEREQMTAAEREATKALDTEILAAFTEGMGGKPTPYLVARVADEMVARLEHGQQITAKQALALVEKSQMLEIRELPPAKLLERLSPQQIEAVRKHLVDQVMTQQPRRVRAPAGAAVRSAPKREMTIEEAFKAKQQSYKR